MTLAVILILGDIGASGDMPSLLSLGVAAVIVGGIVVGLRRRPRK
jgi:hypothetical protein